VRPERRPRRVRVRRVSIHAPRAGRDVEPLIKVERQIVSIHAPRAGRDSIQSGTAATSPSFNPRPRAGRDVDSPKQEPGEPRFQSTRPVRGATWQRSSSPSPVTSFQSTRPVWGATADHP